METRSQEGEVPDGTDMLRGRIEALEHRVATLEVAAGLSTATSRPPADTPAPQPVAAAAPPITEPAPAAPNTWLVPPVTPPAASAHAATGWGAPAYRPGPVAPRAPRQTFAELEERFAGRLLAWTGALALVAAAIFFLSLAFTRGWIGEEARVLIGVAVGVTAFAGGAWFLLRGNSLMGHVLTAIGLGVFTIAIMAATRLYELIPPGAGLALALFASIAAAVIAIRTDSRAIAAFGLVAALVAPPLLGASPDLLTLAFVATVLVGTTVIALFRSWAWLPPVAFLLSAPQLALWLIGEQNAWFALVALTGFWALNVVAAGGEEVRVRRNDLRPTSATLALMNAVFLAAGLLVVFDGDLEPWRSTAYVVAAALHVVIGSWFLARQGLEHRFGTLIAGLGAAFLALAAVAQLGGAIVPAAWALEALVLTWIAIRLEYRYAAWAAVGLGTLSIASFVLVTYPAGNPGLLPGAPFGHEETISLVVVTGALLSAAWLVPVGWTRSALTGVAVLVAAWAGLFELTGSALVAWFAGLAVAGVGLHALAERLPERAVGFVPAMRAMPVGFAEVAGAVAWVAAVGAAIPVTMPAGDLFNAAIVPAVPFTNEAALQGGLLIFAAVAAAGIARRWLTRSVALLAALGVATWLVPFEVFADLVVVLWCGLAVLAWLAGTRETEARPAFEGVAVVLSGLAIGVLVAMVAPPWRLMVQEDPAAWSALLPAWPVSFAAVTALLLLATRLPLSEPARRGLGLAAAGTVVYGASVAVVAAFQANVGGPVAYEELAKQAQVALSVLWTALGVLGLVVGLVTRRVLVRDAGLALLALATAKVFLVDLASLDVAYRVLSLAALGLLLLASAWMFTHFRGGPRPGASGRHGGTVGPA